MTILDIHFTNDLRILHMHKYWKVKPCTWTCIKVHAKYTRIKKVVTYEHWPVNVSVLLWSKNKFWYLESHYYTWEHWERKKLLMEQNKIRDKLIYLLVPDWRKAWWHDNSENKARQLLRNDIHKKFKADIIAFIYRTVSQTFRHSSEQTKLG